VGKLLLALIILVTGGAALVRPWVGICSYYLLSILGPQYIWWWNFDGLRVSLIVSICTFVGVAFKFIGSNGYDKNFLYNKLSLWTAVLWITLVISYLFGPYVDLYTSSVRTPSQLLYATTIIFVFYFMSLMEIDELNKLRYLVVVFVVSTLYLTYWANNQYLSQNWNQFNYGRLMGPFGITGNSIYNDENTFAMLFVTGLPFVYYWGWYQKRHWLRWLLWGVIPLGWHAIFLTGSRGGLVGLCMVLIAVVLLSNRKILALPLLLLFLLFYQWQAGDTMKERSDTISTYETEGSAQQRIAAWSGGLKMMADHPLTGVGLGSFITALPHYSETSPRVAHNTFIQFAAESGVGAGVAYLVIVFIFFRNSINIYRWCGECSKNIDIFQIDLYNKASLVSFVGLNVCSLFLSLNTYEVFFVLLIINNSLNQICKRSIAHGNNQVQVCN